MTGSAPAVTVTLDAGQYAPGAQVTATATITDADDTSEILTTTDELGRRDTITIDRVDPETLLWSWASTGQPLDSANPLTITAPDASDGLVCVATDGQGNRTAATIAVNVVPPMLVGDAAGVNLARYPRQAFAIVFNSPTKGLNVKTALAVPAQCLALVCFKDAPTAALVDPLLDALAGRKIWLCWHQEPEGDLAPADYQAGQRTLAGIIAAHPNGHLVTQVGKLTWYAEEINGKGPWENWWAGVEQVMCEDVYPVVDVNAKAYPTPEATYRDLIAAATAAGVPWAVTEFGLRRLAWDTDGSAQAAAMAAHVAYVRAHGGLVIGYWDGQGTKFPYALSGLPLAAWQTATANQ